ncbi:MAG: DUF4118 domain-containing protein, partial [Panacagrimonas sp.]
MSATRSIIAIVLATAGGIGLHIAMLPLLGDQPTVVPTLLAVLVAAWAAGGVAGIATAALSGALFYWLPLAPPHSTIFSAPLDTVRMALSGSLVVAIGLVCDAMHRAKRLERARLEESRRIQADLRELNHQFQFALEAGQMMTWDWDLGTNVVRRSDAAVSMFGLTNE